MEVDTEMMIANMRMEMRSKEEREGEEWSEEWQWEKLKASRVFDTTSQEMSLSKRKATDLQEGDAPQAGGREGGGQDEKHKAEDDGRI